MATPKDDAYETHIAPLLTQIEALCEKYQINMFATFALDRDPSDDEAVFLTTVQPENDPDDAGGLKALGLLAAVMGVLG